MKKLLVAASLAVCGLTAQAKDIVQTAVDAGNFRYDLNASGSIGAADIAAAKRRAGPNLR